MTTTVLTPTPWLQFFDANGNPLVGGKLYTYASGTTTLLTTYTDSTGVTPNTNPVILNSRGEAAIWLGAATYSFSLKDSLDTLIWTADGINGDVTAGSLATYIALMLGTTGASQVGWLRASANTVATTVQNKLNDWASLKDFGALGDGSVNDTTAFNNAMAGVTSLLATPGNYRLTGVPTALDTPLLSLGGTSYTTNLPPGGNESYMFSSSGWTFSRHMSTAGSTFPAGNEAVIGITYDTPASTSSSGPYEKMGLFLELTHNESAVYAPSFIAHDAVGIECIAKIGAATQGRVYGVHVFTDIGTSGSDGFTNAFDAEVHNTYGSPGGAGVALIDEQLSKNGLMVGMGSTGYDGTKAIGVYNTVGGPQFKAGLVFYPSALAAGAPAMLIPNATAVQSWVAGTYPTTYFNLVASDTSNGCIIGDGAAYTTVTAPFNANASILSTTLQLNTAASTGSAGVLTLGNATAGTAGAAATFLVCYIGTTPYKIQLYAA